MRGFDPHRSGCEEDAQRPADLVLDQHLSAPPSCVLTLRRSRLGCWCRQKIAVRCYTHTSAPRTRSRPDLFDFSMSFGSQIRVKVTELDRRAAAHTTTARSLLQRLVRSDRFVAVSLREIKALPRVPGEDGEEGEKRTVTRTRLPWCPRRDRECTQLQARIELAPGAES